MTAPDCSEALVGWRAWRFGPELGSLFTCEAWAPGTPQRAFCAYGGCVAVIGQEGRHDAPHRSCMCGLHAFKERADALALLSTATCVPRLCPHGSGKIGGHREIVYGETYLWGRVVEHERGYRAEYAYPKCVVVPKAFQCTLRSERVIEAGETAELLRELYGVEAV